MSPLRTWCDCRYPITMVIVIAAYALLKGTFRATFVSLTRKVTEWVPALLGIPDKTPVADVTWRPRGRLPPGEYHHRYGGLPPVTWKVAEYGCPTVPSGSDVVVIRS